MALAQGDAIKRHRQSRSTAHSSVATRETRDIWLLLYPEANLLDIAGPVQVFATAAEQAASRWPSAPVAYRIRLFSREGGLLRTSSGVEIQTDSFCLPACGQRVTLIAAGGHGSDLAMQDSRLLEWLRALAPLAERVASVCTGAFLLAAAGLLDGRRVATHWDYCGRLAARFPQVGVDAQSIYVEDTGFWTSAGVTSGLDMALALVERDLGHELASLTARRLVFYLRRPGTQSQFSIPLIAQTADKHRLSPLTDWIVAHPGHAHAVPQMAASVAMSQRTLYRVFREELQMTPTEFVEQVRLETAKRLLVEGNDTVDRIAFKSGFGLRSRMCAVFQRRLRISPTQYRERFGL
jgi:transcriptional regulator GlxA family with amidase domain